MLSRIGTIMRNPFRSAAYRPGAVCVKGLALRRPLAIKIGPAAGR
jgi:hypothetical protein